VLDNESPLPTTIHFHGLTAPNKDDGVPYVTQQPITVVEPRLLSGTRSTR
jgi:FtsP/CotA-like multicopper oxidase with cupredoxin domain